MVPADGGEEGRDVDVGAHDGVQDPFQAEVGYALKAVFEGVDAGDGNGGGWGETFAGEESKERGFAGAIGWWSTKA